MASLGSFGVSNPTGNQQSRNTQQSAEVAVLTNSAGRKLEGTTHGSEIKVDEDFYAGSSLPDATNLEAVDAQNGPSVVLSHGVSEEAANYAKITKSTTKYPGPVTP